MRIIVKYSIVFIFFKLILFSEVAKAQKISLKNKENIENKIRSFLVSYAKYAKLSQDGKTFSDDYARHLVSMHESGLNTLVYSNIIPDKEPESITLQDYFNKLKSNYKLGFVYTITFGDNISDIGLLNSQSTRLAAYVEVKKSFIGLYNNKRVHRAENKMYILVSFNKSANDIKIEQVSKKIPEIFPLIDYTFSQIELTGALDYAKITNFNSSDYSWVIKEPNLSYSANMNFTYYLGKNFGLGVGLCFSQIQYSLFLQDFSRKLSAAESEIDKDGDVYLPVYSANIDERTDLFLINMPIYSELKFGKLDKINLFVRGGVRLVNILKANVKSVGYIEKMGYYPEYDLLLFNLPAYGYEKNTIDANKQIDLQKFNYLYFGALGLFVPLNSRLLLSITGEYSIGTNSIINTKSTYRENYANITPVPESVILGTYYAKLGLAIKLNK